MAAVYLAFEFFGDERFGAAAVQLGEHPFITEMRVIRCWHRCYTNDTPNLSPRDIRVQARWTGDPAPLIAALLDVGLIEERKDGTYEFRGVAARLEMEREKSDHGRAGGLASAKARQKLKREAEEAAARAEADAALRVNAASTPVNARSTPVDASSTLVDPGQPSEAVSVSEAESEAGTEHTPRNSEPPKRRHRSARVGPPPKENDPEDLAVALEWEAYAVATSDTVKPDHIGWADAVRLLREKDGLTHAEIRALLAFVADESCWWHKLATSLPELRERKSRGSKRKWEKIRDAMERSLTSPPARASPATDPQRDEAVRLADAAIAVALDPPTSATRQEALTEIRRRVPAPARSVVERLGPRAWETFVHNVQSSAARGTLGAERAQLRDAILAELRLSAAVETQHAEA